MKKLIYGGLFLAIVGIGVVGCKKEIQNLPGNVINSNSSGVSFKKIGDVLVFNSWDDVIKQEQLFEGMITAHVELFEKEHEEILRDLRVTVDRIPYKSSLSEVELTWESELAVDSFEMAIGWSEFQPLIDFEKENNFNSLRKNNFDILYADSEDDSPSKLTDEERVYFLTYPIYGEMATLFNENAIIGVGDSLYKVLGNNVWIASVFEKKSTLETLTEDNYENVIGKDGFSVYDVTKKGEGCYANTKRWGDKTTSDQKYRVLGMMTVTNVAVPWGRYVKGRTLTEIKNNKGKWKSRKTFVRVNGGAQCKVGGCDDQGFYPRIVSDQHLNKSKAKDNGYMTEWFRVKSGGFMTLHEGGTGANFLSFTIILN